MQEKRLTAPEISDSSNSKYGKLRVKDLKYFDLNYKSEYNEFIISFKRYIYYYNIFI